MNKTLYFWGGFLLVFCVFCVVVFLFFGLLIFGGCFFGEGCLDE